MGQAKDGSSRINGVTGIGTSTMLLRETLLQSYADCDRESQRIWAQLIYDYFIMCDCVFICTRIVVTVEVVMYYVDI